jgi:hypothetical protein
MPASRHDADEILAAALAAGRTMASAAEAAGVCTKTVRRRLDDPDFRSQVADLKRETTGRAVALLAENAAGAVVELTKLSTGSASEKIRLVASKAVVELALRGLQWEDDRPRSGGVHVTGQQQIITGTDTIRMLQEFEKETGVRIGPRSMLEIQEAVDQVLPPEITG